MIKVTSYITAGFMIGMGLFQLFWRWDFTTYRVVLANLSVGIGTFLAIKAWKFRRKNLLVCPGGIIWYDNETFRAMTWESISLIKVEHLKRLYWKAPSSELGDRRMKYFLEIHLNGSQTVFPLDGEFYANFPFFVKTLFEQARKRQIPWTEIDSKDL